VTTSRRRGSRGRGPRRPAAPDPRPSERQEAPAAAGRGLPARQVVQAAAAPAGPDLRPRQVAPAAAAPSGPGGRRRAVVAVAAAAGVLVASLVVAACQWSAGELGAKAAGPAPGTRARVAARAARPLSIAIPAAGVDARVVPVGLRPDGAMEVPEVDLAGWYRLGPRPGERGPAVIVGHVDSREGPAVFFRLGQLRRGDRIVVGQDGGAAASFAVERVERHPKQALPVARVWNPTGKPVLRLITCGGSFDRSTGHYRDNVIVYARLAS
jgi:hypothetical protein